MSVLPVSKLQLGIICRFKASANAESTEGFGHVDAILPLGAPIGFFAKSGGMLELIFHADSVVRDYSLLASSRPEYVDVKSAKAKPCVSTAYIIDVTLAESLAFESYSAYLRTKQPRYAAAGANCATYAAEALEHAKIMKAASTGWTRRTTCSRR